MGEKIEKPRRIVTARRMYLTVRENLPDRQRNAPTMTKRIP